MNILSRQNRSGVTGDVFYIHFTLNITDELSETLPVCGEITGLRPPSSAVRTSNFQVRTYQVPESVQAHLPLRNAPRTCVTSLHD